MILPCCYYAEHGAAGPAASALQHARSHEPAVPTIWEAMAEVAALSSTGWLVYSGKVGKLSEGPVKRAENRQILKAFIMDVESDLGMPFCICRCC